MLPKDKRPDALARCHEDPTSGHVGILKTVWKLGELFHSKYVSMFFDMSTVAQLALRLKKNGELLLV